MHRGAQIFPTIGRISIKNSRHWNFDPQARLRFVEWGSHFPKVGKAVSRNLFRVGDSPAKPGPRGIPLSPGSTKKTRGPALPSVGHILQICDNRRESADKKRPALKKPIITGAAVSSPKAILFPAPVTVSHDHQAWLQKYPLPCRYPFASKHHETSIYHLNSVVSG